MKRFVLSFLLVIFSVTPAVAMSPLDFSSYGSVAAVKPQFEDLNRAVYTGMNTLTWTDAASPKVFGGNIGVVSGFGSFSKNAAIGLADRGVVPAGVALQAGVGTAGFEVYARYLPKMEFSSDIKTDMLGFGLKYEISNLVSVPGFPDIALFGEYNTFGLTQNRNMATAFGKIDSGIDLKFRSTNFGMLISKNFMILRIYAKAGIQSGSTDMTWNRALQGGVTSKVNGTLSDTQYDVAAGLVIAGIRAEIGSRGGNLGFGLGWGINF